MLIALDMVNSLSRTLLQQLSSYLACMCIHMTTEAAFTVVVALLFYVHGKHLRSCRDGQLT